jgi:hypothetical protein
MKAAENTVPVGANATKAQALTVADIYIYLDLSKALRR